MQSTGHDVTDAQLIELISEDDQAAVAELYDRYCSLVLSLARRVLSDNALAEDVVQDVFVTVWRQARRYDPTRSRVSTWIMAMTHNRAIDKLRYERVRGRGSDTTLDNVPDGGTASDDTEQTAIGNEDAVRIRAALAQLPSKQRDAIELMYFGGYSQSELAERLGEPLGTIKSRVFHGMRRLQELVGDGRSVGGSLR